VVLSFRDLHAQLWRASVNQRLQFPFELLSDPYETVRRQLDVMKRKQIYKVPGHAQEVLNFAKAL
jgi:peroxiredoxin